MNSVELFTGAGGLAMGLSQAGFSHKLLIERDQYACHTIRENQGWGNPLVRDWNLAQEDVCAFDYSSIGDDIDCVAGGPPCQPFSMGGKHLAYQDRRDMFPEAVRAIRELRPYAFIFENVKGLTRRSFSTYFNYIYLQLCYPQLERRAEESWQRHLSRLEQHHTRGKSRGLYYRVVTRVLNAADYGVPQRRERVFFVGFRNDIREEWSFPAVTHTEDALFYSQWVTGEYWDGHKVPSRSRPSTPPKWRGRVERLRGEAGVSAKPWATVRDAISDLPHPQRGKTRSIVNHTFVPGARAYPGHTGSPLDCPAKTLKAGVHGVPGGENMLALPDGSVRYFTVREAARLQTFPDDFYFHGTWTESMRQLGNAVPVHLAYVVARSVRNILSRQG